MSEKMKELNRWQTGLLILGALLLMVGLMWRLVLPIQGACWVTTTGVLLFASMQMLSRYEGSNFAVQRLRLQQVRSDFLFLVMAGLMVMQYIGCGPAWNSGNLWIMCLVIACVLQIYTAFRIPAELEKETRQHEVSQK